MKVTLNKGKKEITAWELVIHKRTTMGSIELKIRLHYMLIYAIIELLKVINIKSHEIFRGSFFV